MQCMHTLVGLLSVASIQQNMLYGPSRMHFKLCNMFQKGCVGSKTSLVQIQPFWLGGARPSGARPFWWLPGSIARSIARSLPRSLDRSIARSLPRSIARSLAYSIARSSLDRSQCDHKTLLARSLDRSLTRELARSIARIDRAIPLLCPPTAPNVVLSPRLSLRLHVMHVRRLPLLLEKSSIHLAC